MATALLVTNTDKVFTDATGDVKILVRTCDFDSIARTGKHCTYCALDEGWVMIGGGAEIEGSPSSARLRGSFPYPGGINPPVYTPDGVQGDCTGNTPDNDLSKDLIAWMARSDGTSSHRLRAYVIGLQVAGMTETQLAGARLVNDATTSLMTQPVKESGGSLHTLVGGGANEVGTQNCYLSESRPNDAGTMWRGSAYCSTPGYLKVYSIMLNRCLSAPGWDRCMDRKIRSITSGAVTGYGTAAVATPYPWVTAGIGGRGTVNGSLSRYLVDLLPLSDGTSQGVLVTTKDQGSSVPGTTIAYSINLSGGRWGTWRFNSIRFNTAGTTLYRPAGNAPVSLMQSTAYPDAEPYRWNLESLGAGQYRLRNANPGQPAGGECAYRHGGTTKVHVGPCLSTDEYKWTVVDNVQNTFKLKNVASGTCLENNDNTVEENLHLAACASGYSTRQSLFLEAFNWPL